MPGTKNRTQAADALPPAVCQEIDRLMADRAHTFADIAAALRAQGHQVSQEDIHRYVSGKGEDRQRLRMIGEHTRQLVQSLRDRQDVEASEVANALLMDALTLRIANAGDEFNRIPLEKAGQLLVALQRSVVYKTRTMEDKRRLVNRMQKVFLERVRQQVQGDEELIAKLAALAAKAGQEALDAEG